MRYVLAVAVCLLCGACDSSTGLKETHVGTYRLQTVGGEPLPSVLFEIAGVKFEVLAMTFELKSGGTFEASSTFRRTEEGEVIIETNTETGTYTISGTTLTFVHEAETYIGTLIGETMTLTDPGGDLVLVKV